MQFKQSRLIWKWGYPVLVLDAAITAWVTTWVDAECPCFVAWETITQRTCICQLLRLSQKQDDNISFLAESQSTTHYQHWESTEKGFPVKLGNTSKELHCGQAVEGKWTVRLSDGKTCDLGLNWHRRENSLMCLYWSWSTLYRAAFPTVPRLELMGW